MNYFDLHCDTAYECFKTGQRFYVNSLALSGIKGEVFERWCQTFAFFIKDDCPAPFSLYYKMYLVFLEKLKERPKNLTPVFSIEGGGVIERNIERLSKLKSDGCLFFSLAWNGETALAGGVNSTKGLTDLGTAAIKELNRLKIGLDLSHLNEASFWPALNIADFPLATHSNCYALCKHKRNLSDDALKEIKNKGGVIGICFYPEFLPHGVSVFEGVYKNICHLLSLDPDFENHIAIGSDFDGAKMDKTLDSVDKIPLLYDFLKRRGLSDELLDKIFYLNAQKYVENLTYKL